MMDYKSKISLIRHIQTLIILSSSFVIYFFMSYHSRFFPSVLRIDSIYPVCSFKQRVFLCKTISEDLSVLLPSIS